MFVTHASEMVQTTWNFDFFDKKPGFYNHFWQRIDAILEDVSVVELLFNDKPLL